jgi:hypothetical protein
MESINRASSETQESPFNNEVVPAEHIKVLKIDKNKLVFDGEEVPGVGYASNLRTQDLGDIAVFECEDNDTTKTSFFDKNDPKREMPSVTDSQGKILVNGVPWKALDGKTTYNGGRAVTMDAVTESLVFRAHDKIKDQDSVVVDSVAWKNTFKSISGRPESINKMVMLIGAVEDGKNNRLWVNDKKWEYNELVSQNGSSSYEEHYNSTGNEKGAVAVAMGSVRGETGKNRVHVMVGDKNKAKSEWKTNFDINDWKNPLKLVLDKNSETLAAFGMIEEVPTLVINDIVCPLASQPESVEALRVENGEVFIQYTNPVGKKFAEKISIKENAEELRQQNEAVKKQEAEMLELYKFLKENKMSPADVMKKMQAHDQLEVNNKELAGKYSKQNDAYQIAVAERNNYNTLAQNTKEDFKVQKEKLEAAEQKIDSLKAVIDANKPGKTSGFMSKKTGIDEEIYTQFTKALNQ